MKKNMNSIVLNLKIIVSLAKTFSTKNPYFVIVWLFLRYAHFKLYKLTTSKVKFQVIPRKILENYLKKWKDASKNYIDEASSAVGKIYAMQTEVSKTYFVCSKITHRKYKLQIVHSDDCEEGRIVVSEMISYNIAKALGHELECATYFMMPTNEESFCIASEASISMISNPCNCPNDLVDCLLENYFRVPRYLREKDVFCIAVKDNAADFFYVPGAPGLNEVFFRVNLLRVEKRIQSTNEACYIVRGVTELLQAANIQAYFPKESLQAAITNENEIFHLGVERCCIQNFPPLLEKPLHLLHSCVAPFLEKDLQMKIQPVFLVKGEPGSGKFKLIETLAKRTGLNLFNADFAEVQSLSAVQTETKLRIVLQNARDCVPCILRLSNIQIFGKNSEGQKDERIVSAFASELKNINAENLEYPLIVIATLENDELDADIDRLFIESVCIEHPNLSQRAETLSWLLKSKGLEHQADLTKIAGLVTDFRLADLESLVIQAAKFAYQSRSSTEKYRIPLVLERSHFIKACEHMQSTFNDRVGAPRIPKVYWDDIGGLASLKHEIKRRIELPMFESLELGRSGLLLYGPPGTGKTLLAKAVATECQLHFMSIKGPELLNMYVGQSEKNIRQVFERARAAAPCVIFFDELDSLAPNRGRSGDSGGVMDRVVSQLLAEMDGLRSSTSIFIIGATNRPDLIDPALLRPGRFDKMLYVGIYSDLESQLSVLRAVTRRFKLKENGDELEKLVKELPKNLTGADLYAVCSDAWLLAVRRNIAEIEKAKENGSNKICLEESCMEGVTLELQDFVDAARNLVPSVNSEELARYEKLRIELNSMK